MADIHIQYQKLRDYCEAFWNRVKRVLGDQIVCKKGCSICCELPSVNYLEASVIAGYCAKHPEALVREGAAPDIGPECNGPCLFLTDDACRIYGVRPIICTTHGLLLCGDSFREPVSISCPYNFTGVDLASVDQSLVLDIEKISDNLARLNAAFCLLLGDVGNASHRVPLRDLALGRVTDAFFSRSDV